MNKFKIYKMIVHLVLLTISCALFINAPKEMNKLFLLNVVALAVFTFIIHIKLEKNLHRNNMSKIYLRHSIFFLIGFFIVFFQCYVDYLLGFIDELETDIWINREVVCPSASLALMSLNSFCLGYRLNQKREKKFVNTGFVNINIIYPYKRFLCFFCYFLLGLYVVLVDKQFLLGGYAHGEADVENGVIMIILQAAIISLFAMYAIEFRNRKLDGSLFFREMKSLIFVAFLYILFTVISGARGNAIRVASLLLIFYLYVVGRNVNYKRLFILLFGVTLVFTLIGIVRSMYSFNVGEGIKLMSNIESFSPLTRELAGSVKVSHVALDNFPNRFAYTNGLSFFPGFSNLIPGLSRINPYLQYSSGLILTSLYFSGEDLWGIGSNPVADAYISFGPIGTMLVFVILGFFIRSLERRTFCILSSPYLLVLSFCCYSKLFTLNRSEFSDLFTSLSYALICTFLFTRIKKISKKQLRKQ